MRCRLTGFLPRRRFCPQSQGQRWPSMSSTSPGSARSTIPTPIARTMAPGIRTPTPYTSNAPPRAAQCMAAIKQLASRASERAHHPRARSDGSANYFSDVLITPNFVFNAVPTPLTAEIIASAMPAAISPYSIAVAPLSSAMNSFIFFLMTPSTRYAQTLVKLCKRCAGQLASYVPAARLSTFMVLDGKAFVSARAGRKIAPHRAYEAANSAVPNWELARAIF